MTKQNMPDTYISVVNLERGCLLIIAADLKNGGKLPAKPSNSEVLAKHQVNSGRGNVSFLLVFVVCC